ncbi:MAG: peptide-methionine (R)-S-oxide reductase MsrB [Nanoarchaeota archaeon]
MVNIKYEKATFSGGCFWCTEYNFDQKPGIIKVISGYAGGKEKDPKYEDVSSGKTSHRESIQIIYDSKKISYTKLLDLFWESIDPTDKYGQFVDRGEQYTTAIYYENEKQKKEAEKSKNNLEKSGKYNKLIVTEIIPFTTFYPAEEYHQNYYKKNLIKYLIYRNNSGRDNYPNNISSNKTLFKRNKIENNLNEKKFGKLLTPLQYDVTQNNKTEKAFDNEYWDNKEEGIYVDIISGKPLFSSKDKFDSGTGWPSFTKPLIRKNIIKKKDFGLIFPRIEIRSKQANSHLGHLFNDGPKNKGGLRYCMNSAALKFIPKENLKKGIYKKFIKNFR